MEVREPCAKYLTSQFKRTEAGDIPIDWIDKPIGEMAEVTSGGTPSRQVAAFWDGDIPWVTTAELDGGQVTEASQHITAAGLQNSAAKWLPAGTILIALYGQGKTRGKCAVLRIAATTNQACAGIKLKESVVGDFVRHNLAQRYDYIRSLSNGGSQENLSGEIVKKIRVGMPSTRAEQRAIADALTDADALIESLEQLLTKKRQIKQGAMQELLTGKRRLPGCELAWSSRLLRDISHMKSGEPVTAERLRDTHPFPCYGGNGLRGYADSFTHDGHFALIGRQGALCGNVVLARGRFFASEHAVVVTPIDGVDIVWLHYVLIRMNLNQYSESSAQPGLAVERLLQLDVLVPEASEQEAIAQVLADMDAEITALESRLTKARALKQAMAQALLTGRIRIPLASQEPAA